MLTTLYGSPKVGPRLYFASTAMAVVGDDFTADSLREWIAGELRLSSISISISAAAPRPSSPR